MSALIRPIPAALAVLPRGDALLLVRRRNPPDAGLWGYPGGKIELGESVAEAAIRELREETGVIAGPRRTLTSIDVILRDDAGGLTHHFILIAVLCAHLDGEPEAADDALDAAWIPVDQVLSRARPMSAAVDAVARLALESAPQA